MGRSKERIIAKFLLSHKQEVGEDAFERYANILMKTDPTVFEEKKKGRPVAETDPRKLISFKNQGINIWGWEEEEKEDAMAITDDYSGIGELFFGSANQCARIAICLIEMGYFKQPIIAKSIYHIIKTYSDVKFKEDIFVREFCEMYYTNPHFFPEEQRKEYREILNDMISDIKALYKDYMNEMGYDDYYYDY